MHVRACTYTGVCAGLFVTECVRVLCLWHLSVDQAPLHVAEFLAPLGRKLSEKHSHSGRARDKHGEGGKSILFILGISIVHTILSVPTLVCEKLENQGDRETSREKEGGSKECVYSPPKEWHNKNFSDRLSLAQLFH